MAVAASVHYYASGAQLAAGDVASHLLGYALLGLLLVGMGARNPWARVFFALFLGWNLFLAVSNLALDSAQLPRLYRLDQLILAAQCLAALLLFLPSSSAWFRARP